MSSPVTIQTTGAFGGYTPGATMVGGGSYGVAHDGDVSAALTPDAATQYTKVVEGDLSLEIQIASDITRINSFSGDVSLQIDISSELSNAFVLSGDVSLALSPESPTEQSVIRYLSDPIELGFSAASLLEFDDYEGVYTYFPSLSGSIDETVDTDTGNIVQTLPSLSGSIDQTVDVDSGDINPTVDTDTGSIGATP